MLRFTLNRLGVLKTSGDDLAENEYKLTRPAAFTGQRYNTFDKPVKGVNVPS